MKTSLHKTGLIGLSLLLLSFSNAWAGRILIDDNNQTVTLNQALDCFNAADISIDTRNPEIYDHGSRQLQNITDTVRAMLSYECPGLSEINLTGMVRGLQETVYQGNLSARNGWQIETLSLDSGQYLPASPSVQARAKITPSSEVLSLTGLSLGMSIAAAIEAVEISFDISPQYDPDNGMMTLQTGGCPEDLDINNDIYQANAEWKCLKVWFSDKRIPALERVELIQVVQSKSNTIKQLLNEKYGEPGLDTTSALTRKNHLVWYASSGTGNEMQSLDAQLSEIHTNRNQSRLMLTHLTLSTAMADNTNPVAAGHDIGMKL